MSPGTTFLKLWEFPTSSLLGSWEVFETLEFDRPETLATVTTMTLKFVVEAAVAETETETEPDERQAGEAASVVKEEEEPGSADGEVGAEGEEDFGGDGDDEYDDLLMGYADEDEEDAGEVRAGGVEFAGFVCYMDVDLLEEVSTQPICMQTDPQRV